MAARRLISRAALAKLARVSRTAVTKACKKQLAKACVADRIDVDHPLVRAYLEARPSAKPKPAKGKGRGRPVRGSPSVAPEVEIEAALAEPQESDPNVDVDPYAALLEPLVERFGTNRSFQDWLQALQKIESVRRARLDNAETEGRLISRELVKTHVFGAIEASHRRLLMDTPKTAARRIYGAAKSGVPIEEAEEILREVISSQLKPVKATATRVLRSA